MRGGAHEQGCAAAEALEVVDAVFEHPIDFFFGEVFVVEGLEDVGDDEGLAAGGGLLKGVEELIAGFAAGDLYGIEDLFELAGLIEQVQGHAIEGDAIATDDDAQGAANGEMIG